MRDRLVKLVLECRTFTPEYAEQARLHAEYVADHLLANSVIVLPCKVGDTVYALSQMRDKRILPFISECEVTSIKVGKKKCLVYHEMDGYIKIFKQEDFGKTVFLTREEAEQALAKMKDGAE